MPKQCRQNASKEGQQMENLTPEQLRLLERKANEKAHKDADRHFALITNYMRRFNLTSYKASQYERQNLLDIKRSVDWVIANCLDK
jgi:hypothetical protein